MHMQKKLFKVFCGSREICVKPDEFTPMLFKETLPDLRSHQLEPTLSILVATSFAIELHNWLCGHQVFIKGEGCFY